MRTPNLNSLRMFDAAARHLNFRLAAEELNLTQGAVAQQVRRLEADLGLKLFHRVARGLTLTEIGSNYHAPVRRAIGIIDDATRKLRPENTRITLSVTPSLAAKWLVPRLSSFAQLHPGIEVQTVASEGLSNFQSDGVDIAIRQGRPPFGNGLHTELLAPLDLRAVCSESYAMTTDVIVRFEDFAKHQLIQDSHRHWDALFEKAGVTAPDRMMQFNQTALAMDAAANGQGVALAPRLLLDIEFAQGKLTQLWQDTQTEQSGYYIVYPHIQTPNATGRGEVIDWLLSAGKDVGV